MRGSARTLPAIEVLALLLATALPLILSQFQVIFLTRLLILSLLALSFDFAWGQGGVFSFGQGLFFGLGAYVAALLATRADMTSAFVAIPLAMLAGLVVASLFGGFLLLGRRPASLIYIGMATLAASYAAQRLAAGWSKIGGQNGVSGVPFPTLGGADLEPGRGFYYVALALLVAVYLAFRYLSRSQFGLVLAAARDNESRVGALGYRTAPYKWLVFALAGGVAGLSGGLSAFHEGFAGPNLLGVLTSTQAVLYVLVGGVGTLAGAVGGVFVMEYASLELSTRFASAWPVILGGILLLVIMFLPNGLIGAVISDRARMPTFGDRRAKPKRVPVDVSEEETVGSASA